MSSGEWVAPLITILLVFGVSGILFMIYMIVDLLRLIFKRSHKKQENAEKTRTISFFDIGVIVLIIAAAITYIFQQFKRRRTGTEVTVRNEEK